LIKNDSLTFTEVFGVQCKSVIILTLTNIRLLSLCLEVQVTAFGDLPYILSLFGFDVGHSLYGLWQSRNIF